MRYGGGRRKSMSLLPYLIFCVLVAGLGLLMLALRPLDPPIAVDLPTEFKLGDLNRSSLERDGVGMVSESLALRNGGVSSCATVEEMGMDFRKSVGKESLKVRRIIENHFLMNGTFGS